LHSATVLTTSAKYDSKQNAAIVGKALEKMSASSPVLQPANLDEPVGLEKKWEEPASDANTMVEKYGKEAEEEPANVPEEDQILEDEYPKGIKFAVIIIALMLSVFMVALDMVCLALVY
jgi:hypothetical protein